MDVGAHRKRVYDTKPSVDNELWKRAFCFDLDLPLEVDDDYWKSGDSYQTAFTQPIGNPSVVSGFVSLLKLTQIMAHALRTIRKKKKYCIDKSKVLLGLVSDDWQEQIVSQLNTALDEWVESVPEHLRWAAHIENEVFANQSATIYSTYYLVLILIYRPFSQASVYLPQQDVPAKPSKPFPFPADSICANAAHSAIRIIDVQTRRGMSNVPNMISVAQMCAVTQLMGLYVLRASRESDAGTKARERDRIMQDIERCIHCLELVESRWIMARKFIQSFSDSLPSPSDSHDFKGKEKFDYNDGPLASRVPSIHIQPSTSGGSSQSWSSAFDVRPLSTMSDSEQALTNRANWRWFHENPTFAQQRIGKRHVGDPLRHHVPQLVPSSNPHEVRFVTPGMEGGFARRVEIDPRESSQLRSAPPLPPVVSEEPISSRSRGGERALASGQALSIVTLQSAVCDEQVGGWNRQAAAVRVPQHPYASLHQTPRQVYRYSALILFYPQKQRNAADKSINTRLQGIC
ncbi:hypothetical protein EW145_g6716 [Phellinidium pouzarii]|uniref:Transcription factor domain-containing protein n=1 Tax=Phellinidium pouzarii TaxID=167371 RepID=A0A4S4KVI3_9AGAM|nr:hypothetical protein EW145_g6716 [Phellinidium pouzarii]